MHIVHEWIVHFHCSCFRTEFFSEISIPTFLLGSVEKIHIFRLTLHECFNWMVNKHSYSLSNKWFPIMSMHRHVRLHFNMFLMTLLRITSWLMTIGVHIMHFTWYFNSQSYLITWEKYFFSNFLDAVFQSWMVSFILRKVQFQDQKF